MIAIILSLVLFSRAEAAKIDCADPSIVGSMWSGSSDPTICYDAHPLDAAHLAMFASFQARARILLNEWLNIWPIRSRTLETRISLWRRASQRASDEAEDSFTPGIAWITRAENDSDIEATVAQAARTRYLRLAADAALAHCPDAVTFLMKAAKIATGSMDENDSGARELQHEATAYLKSCRKKNH